MASIDPDLPRHYQWTNQPSLSLSPRSKPSWVDREGCCYFPTMETLLSTRSNIIPLIYFGTAAIGFLPIEGYRSALWAVQEEGGNNRCSQSPSQVIQSHLLQSSKEEAFSIIYLFCLERNNFQYGFLTECMLNSNMQHPRTPCCCSYRTFSLLILNIFIKLILYILISTNKLNALWRGQFQ